MVCERFSSVSLEYWLKQRFRRGPKSECLLEVLRFSPVGKEVDVDLEQLVHRGVRCLSFRECPTGLPIDCFLEAEPTALEALLFDSSEYLSDYPVSQFLRRAFRVDVYPEVYVA